MRGKVPHLPAITSRARITPAYAGKSSVYLPCSRGCTDHPRLCGEKIQMHRIPLTVTGSPPPMRGKEMERCSHDAGVRITPAYAGKRYSHSCPSPCHRDHPRLCGEKCEMPSTAFLCLGSPPPMRGKVSFGVVEDILDWITPAYAGKSFRKTAVRHAIKDHPRLCGEKLQDTADFTHVAGSPPPMRGKGHSLTGLHLHRGITPAYAGKRNFLSQHQCFKQDHPRLCGEKCPKLTKTKEVTGSPPPMRGKVAMLAKLIGKKGITPAYAGKRFW